MISSARCGNVLPEVVRWPYASDVRLFHVLLLVALVVLSSLGYIYLKYRMQERFLELNHLNARWYQLHEQSDQLHLERQTLLTRSYMLAKAEHLGMKHHR